MNSILVFVIVLALAMALARGVASLECEASGYCSLGHSKQWIGDIRLGAKLKEMLASVSFRKELIVVAVTKSDLLHLGLWRGSQRTRVAPSQYSKHWTCVSLMASTCKAACPLYQTRLQCSNV